MTIKLKKMDLLTQLNNEMKNFNEEYERNKERWIKSRDPDDLHFLVSSMEMLNKWQKKIFHHKYQEVDKKNRILDKKLKEEKKIYD